MLWILVSGSRAGDEIVPYFIEVSYLNDVLGDIKILWFDRVACRPTSQYSYVARKVKAQSQYLSRRSRLEYFVGLRL